MRLALKPQVQGEGMKVAMKNLVWDDDKVDLGALAAGFDFGINEECYAYNECGVSASADITRFQAPSRT